MYNYRKINYEVMLDTKHQYETEQDLVAAVLKSISCQYFVAQEDIVDVAPVK